LSNTHSPLRAKSVADISTDDVLKVLTPIWQTKAETASRLRGRIERVLDYAKARGWRNGENPALWRGHLKNILPARQKLTRGHHAAMPYKDVPAFIEQLPGKDAMAARGLEFLILTAARSGEVLGATWQEMDLEKRSLDHPGKAHESGQGTSGSPVTKSASHCEGTARNPHFRFCLSRTEKGSTAFRHVV
jgi:integrase